MIARLLLAAWCFAVMGTPAGAAPAAPGAPPDGTYVYALYANDAEFGRSQVVLRRDGDAIAIDERAAVGPATATIHSKVSAATLAPIEYESAYATDSRSESRHVTLDDAHAQVAGVGPAPETISLVAGSAHFSIFDQAFVSGFALLPAQIAFWQPKVLTGVLPLRAVGFPLVLASGDDGTIPRPAFVKAGDVSVAFASPTPLRVWYDPQTMVLDGLEVPAQNLQIRLVSRSLQPG